MEEQLKSIKRQRALPRGAEGERKAKLGNVPYFLRPTWVPTPLFH